MAGLVAPLIRRRTRTAELSLVGVLIALAAAAFVITVVRMRGMDDGPGTDPGAIGFFVGVWVVMMAAMMLPSAAPMVVVYSRVQRARGATALFVAGYLVTWTAAGLVAYGLAVAARHAPIGALSWNRGGRYVVAAILVGAAAYQLTPLKARCLARCRGPLSFILTSWREGRAGALRMGAGHGAWCVGCCWALMASLFALGVMSIAWMAAVAALIAAEKLLPWPAAVNRGIAAILCALAFVVAVSPSSVPALTTPGHMSSANAMHGGSAHGMPATHAGSMKGMH